MKGILKRLGLFCSFVSLLALGVLNSRDSESFLQPLGLVTVTALKHQVRNTGDEGVFSHGEPDTAIIITVL